MKTSGVSCETKFGLLVFLGHPSGEGDEEQEDGGEVGGQQLCGEFPFHFQGHVHHVAIFCLFENQVCYHKHGQVFVIGSQVPKAQRLTCIV